MAKILLVEDDNNLREIYEARLQAEGYTIVSASDGEEALAVAKKEHPDLIISDVMMPRISGFEMLDILRNTEGLRDVRVIMLTALGQAEDQSRANALGADRYLVKSQVTLEDIVKAAQELLAGAPSDANGAATAAKASGQDGTTPGAAAASSTAPAVAPSASATVPNAPAAPAATPQPAVAAQPAAVSPPVSPAATPAVPNPLLGEARPSAPPPTPAAITNTVPAHPTPISTPAAPPSPTANTAADAAAAQPPVKPLPQLTKAQPPVHPPRPAAAANSASDTITRDQTLTNALNDLVASTPAAAAPPPTPPQPAAPPSAPTPAAPAQAQGASDEQATMQAQIEQFIKNQDESQPGVAPTPVRDSAPAAPEAQPQTPPAEPANEQSGPDQQNADAVPIAHKKVIKPLSDLSASTGPNLNELLAKEGMTLDENEKVVPASPSATVPAAPAPPADLSSPKPGDDTPVVPHPPGHVIAPNGPPPSDTTDPDSIAL